MGTIWSPDLSSARGPKYAALAASIRRAIQDGQLRAGSKLPPVRSLATTLSVTPGTVARAYGTLRAEGALMGAQGSGTFVARPEDFEPSEPYLTALSEEGEVNLRTALVPDVGQGIEIAAAMRAAADVEDWARHPNRSDDAALARAILDWQPGIEIGPAEPRHVVPALGGQHAVVLVMQAALRGPRPRVVTDELAYSGFRHAAALARAEISGLPWDDHGPKPAAFDAACRLGGVQLYCTSSECHNPTTLRTTDDRRAEMVEIARRYDVQILDDDCFISGGSLAPLYRGLAPERVWHVGSLSKRVSPLLRLGFLIAPEGRQRDAVLTAQHQFFGLPRPVAATGLHLLETGAAQRVKVRVRAANRRMVAEARRAFEGCDFLSREEVPLIWLTMPRGWRASSFEAAAKARGVLVKPADLFALPDGRAPNAVRIALNGAIGPDALGESLGVLRDLLDHPPTSIEV
ncbi:DNA-binding transcriptional MocR family regulator [Hasllibacter halocynthiae]|uniref:DNA-binding transcriptional MocR family regulator n=1 Tax=Hasllibacter halocynthiae TaxID=595589 RepID=A0A2T0X8E9_9RHOB|nr:PLP-dependent aminotransferase family protein [Hasllibacter halocynthiae]PRY95197.1 DNA-binding transcriptional MocR family regulator [Hasllibacter halocynthiae]